MPRRLSKTLSSYSRIFLWIAALAIWIATLAVSAWAQDHAAKQAPDPLVADPQHVNLELENQWVRVFQEHMGPHEGQPMHQHPGPGAVIVFLTDRNNQLTYFDGSVKACQNHAGEIMWATPTAHSSQNLLGAQFAALQIEPRLVANPKPFPTETTDPVIVDPTHYQVVIENEWIRAIRATVAPHEKLMMHKHPATGAVVINLSDQDMRQFHAHATSHESHFKAGKVRSAPPLVAHQTE